MFLTPKIGKLYKFKEEKLSPQSIGYFGMRYYNTDTEESPDKVLSGDRVYDSSLYFGPLLLIKKHYCKGCTAPKTTGTRYIFLAGDQRIATPLISETQFDQNFEEMKQC